MVAWSEKGVCEQFHKTVGNEFCPIAFRKEVHHSIVQAQLDGWLAMRRIATLSELLRANLIKAKLQRVAHRGPCGNLNINSALCSLFGPSIRKIVGVTASPDTGADSRSASSLTRRTIL